MSRHKESERDKQDCIVIIAPCCNRVIMATANDEYIDAVTIKQIGYAVAAGKIVEHKTAEEVRKMPFGCRCPDRTVNWMSLPKGPK